MVFSVKNYPIEPCAPPRDAAEARARHTLWNRVCDDLVAAFDRLPPVWLAMGERACTSFQNAADFGLVPNSEPTVFDMDADSQRGKKTIPLAALDWLLEELETIESSDGEALGTHEDLQASAALLGKVKVGGVLTAFA